MNKTKKVRYWYTRQPDNCNLKSMAIPKSGVSAILLAAGESRRMLAFKQLLKIRGKSFIAHCVDTLLSSKVDEIVVVTGHRAEDVRYELSGREVRLAHNEAFNFGMSSSIVKGVQELSPDAQACLIALSDQPLVPSVVVDQLIAVYLSKRPLVLIPTFQGKGGHPVLIDLSLRMELETLEPTEGLKAVIKRRGDLAMRVEVASQSVLLDFDYPEDYAAIADET